ncbi:hypothetical protein DPEC_G00010930 [Dallia pectoralis]|uniref:Uncharacterized protein n=1 Tax=Dallia pectoralis TaxID=75939 RepID=A0ACC2HL65_DALPE|nr:hypothetical protein DPEC_G00010930 [Dallia pectoralis]
MAEKMSFLTIPPRKDLFTTVNNNEGSQGQRYCYDEGQCNSDEDYDESEETRVRLIPRSSPIPRKRGQSIYDETAEYMIIKDVSPSRRVSFADTIGGDLAEVKEFVQFNSDEENESRWEEEEAKYRPKMSEPTYSVIPGWTVPTAAALTQAVHTNKVEVESVSPIEDEPLAFVVYIRVLNISFKKTVCVRSTMDNWSNYFDCPAEYVQGDGETDTFSYKLSFCPPYLYQGARIEFVVRYETPDGDYWANNSHMNYPVTLIVSYEENVTEASTDDMSCRRGILKTESSYRMEDSEYFEQFTEKGEDEPVTETSPGIVKPILCSPDVLGGELDLETADHIPSSPLPANLDFPSADGSLFCATVSLGNQSPVVSSTSTTNEVISTLVATQANIVTTKPEPSLELVCETLKQDCELPKPNCEKLKLGGELDALPRKGPKGGCSTALNVSSAPLLSSIDEASEPTTWLIIITEVSDCDDEVEEEVEEEVEVGEKLVGEEVGKEDVVVEEVVEEEVVEEEVVEEDVVEDEEVQDEEVEDEEVVEEDEEVEDEEVEDEEVVEEEVVEEEVVKEDVVEEDVVEDEEVEDEEVEDEEVDDEVVGPFQEEPKDSSLPTLLSVSTTSDRNLTEPDPPHLDIHPKLSSLGKLPDIAIMEVGVKLENELPNQESEVDKEVPRKEEEKETEENKKPFRNQELVTSSTGFLEHPSGPSYYKLNQICVGSSPSLPEESYGKKLSLPDVFVTREDGVLMTEAVEMSLEISQVGAEEFPGAEASCAWPSSKVTQSLASQTVELTNVGSQTPPPASHQLFKRAEAGVLAAVLFDDSGSSKEQDDVTDSADIVPVLDGQALMGVQCQVESSVITTPEGTSSSNEKGQTSAAESEESFKLSSETLEGLPSGSPEAQIPSSLTAQAEPTLGRTVIPSVVCLSVVIGLVLGIQEPSTFVFMGLFILSLYF